MAHVDLAAGTGLACLYHAVLAMTCYHGSQDVPPLRLAGHEHKTVGQKPQGRHRWRD